MTSSGSHQSLTGSASTIRDKLTALDSLFADIRSVVERHDLDRRRLLIEQRRSLATVIAELNTSGELLLSTTPEAGEFRRRLSEFRGQLASHQAAWPAVTIEDSADYRQSARKLLTTYQTLSDWLRSAANEVR